MTCKFCGRVKSAIRSWLGIDEILTRQGEYYTNYVNNGYAELQRKIYKLTQAGSDLELTLGRSENDAALVSKQLLKSNKEIADRFDVLRGKIRENRMEWDKLQSLVKDQDREISSIAESVQRLEFPGFKPIEPFEPEAEPDLDS